MNTSAGIGVSELRFRILDFELSANQDAGSIADLPLAHSSKCGPRVVSTRSRN